MIRKIGSFITAVLALTLFLANPSFAQVVSFRDAYIGYGEGNRNGVVSLDLAGNSEVQTYAQTMTFDADAGRWIGFGRIDYEGNGVSVHESNAAFSIRVELIPADLQKLCSPTPVPNPSYAAHIEARNAAGQLVLVAGMPRNIAEPGQCPRWELYATLGQNLPESTTLMKSKYRDGANSGGPKTQRSTLKSKYVTPTGRIIVPLSLR